MAAWFDTVDRQAIGQIKGMEVSWAKEYYFSSGEIDELLIHRPDVCGEVIEVATTFKTVAKPFKNICPRF
jgi:predicted oxidoreductase